MSSAGGCNLSGTVGVQSWGPSRWCSPCHCTTIRTPKQGLFSHNFFVKVVAFYRWLNGALNGSPKLPLIVNMDECSLAYHQTCIRGTVLRTQPLRSVRPEDRARLGDRRGNITYMASIHLGERANLPGIPNLTGSSPPRSARVQTEGSKKMLDPNRCQEITPVQLDPVTLPSINKPEGIPLCSDRP